MIKMLILVALSILPLCFLLLALTTFILATITWLRQFLFAMRLPTYYSSSSSRNSNSNSNSSDNAMCTKLSSLNTALYCGRVSHTRFHPVVHSFSYPLFFCLLDLSEVHMLFHNKDKRSNRSSSKPLLWPLNLFMTFREEDHLKNGEGLLHCKNHEEVRESDKKNISSRIIQLVSEKTNGKCNPTPEQKILLLTHLSYYGYCFNPVSFYYILKDGTFDNNNTSNINDSIEAIVAEVSNTPWNEMKCYVLHPDSNDMTFVKEGRTRKFTTSKKKQSIGSNIRDNDNNDDDDGNGNNNSRKSNNDLMLWKSINYIFDKKFHVSPFMEMDYIYDWTFWQMNKDEIVVNTNMIKKVETHDGSKQDDPSKNNSNDGGTGGVKCFSAFFDIHRSPFNPFSLCYQLVKFPIYCLLIQLWIHIEALKLFMKGVEFIPHPEEVETTASAIIATIMQPFFTLKDWISKKEKTE